jgi:uncharacterized protein (DUF1499 family)
MLLKILTGSAAVVVALALLLLAAGPLGWLQGQPPTDLGVRMGRLTAPSTRPNSVSSQAALFAGHPMQQAAMIAPLPLVGDAAAAMLRLRGVVQALPGAALVEQRDDYLYVRFTSRWMGFVDDVEFWADPVAGVIQLRSASRLGESDMGVNRARIEQIRALLAEAA